MDPRHLTLKQFFARTCKQLVLNAPLDGDFPFLTSHGKLLPFWFWNFLKNTQLDYHLGLHDWSD